MAKAKVDTSALVQHLQDEYADLGDLHPERSAEIREQLKSLGAEPPDTKE